MGVHLKETPLTFRRKQKHPLDKLIKLTAKELEDTVDRLVVLAKSKDEKIALGANTKLVEMHMDAVNAVEKDDITRTLAELKENGPRRLEAVDEDSVPQIDFDNVQNV